MINNILYIDQKRNEEAYIPDIIEVAYNHSSDIGTIKPFKVIYNNKEYICDGLTSSIWHPSNNDIFYLKYEEEKDKFELWSGTITMFNLFKEMPDTLCFNDIGIVIWVENNIIHVLRHV